MRKSVIFSRGILAIGPIAIFCSKNDPKSTKNGQNSSIFDEKMPKLTIFEISDFGQFEVF